MESETVVYTQLDRVVRDLRAVADECEKFKAGENVLPVDAFPPALNRIASRLRDVIAKLEPDGGSDLGDSDDQEPKRGPGRPRRQG